MIAAMRAALLFVCAAGVVLSAQATKNFKARLSPVPIDITMQATVAGSGSVTASLAGAKLTVSGTFDGLKSPATTAKIRKSPVRGVRGPELLTLTVSGATSGTIAGSFDLTPQQVGDLQGGRLYVQLQSEKAPDGNLWGWLLLQEKR
jgi:CHRD domain